MPVAPRSGLQRSSLQTVFAVARKKPYFS